MSYRDWHAGMKLVYLGGSRAIHGMETLPVANKVYTLRSITADGDMVGVLLKEIVNRKQYCAFRGAVAWMEPHFLASNFRPVQKRKTDISIFTAMLNPAKQRERA